MTEDEGIRIIAEASELGVKEVVFSGGEPLLWPSLNKAAELACKRELEVSIYTTGNVPDVSSRMQQFASLGVSRCIFSLFGSEYSIHEKITRQKGSYRDTLKAVECAKTYNLHPEIHFVPFSNNYREIESVAKLAKKYGIHKVSVLRFVPQGRGHLFRKHQLNRLQNAELRISISNLRGQGYEIRTGSPYNFLLLNDKTEAQCPSGIDRLIIGPDLRIYPCDAFKQIKAEELVRTLEYSSLDGYSLSECWNRSPFLSAVRKYITTPFVAPCVDCQNLESCLSGCLAQKVIENGDFRKCADPECIARCNYDKEV